MAAGAKQNGFCADETTLSTEITEGAGKCMPTIAKTRENTGRPACGPERSWPPDRVTSQMTMKMPPVSVDDLKARLYFFPSKKVVPYPTALCMPHSASAQRNKSLSGQPWVEPLVRKHCNAHHVSIK